MSDKILFVVTAASRMGDESTGFWFEELSAPYYVFTDAGKTVDLVTLTGGEAPVDARSLSENEDERAENVKRFLADEQAMSKLRHTGRVADVNFDDYDAVFFPGGHGAVVDLPEDRELADKVARAFEAGKVIGAVCHGPGGLLGARTRDGRSILDGRRVNGFTNEEEEAVGLTGKVPFLLEDRMRELGGQFERGAMFEPYAVRDGNLVTGQNPQSSEVTAKKVLEALGG